MFICFGAKLVMLSTLYSKITPKNAGGREVSIWNVEDKPGSAICKTNAIPAELSL